jgi:periplasmic protein CpxP/Spy
MFSTAPSLKTWRHSSQPKWRLFAATFALALLCAVMQAAMAAPMDGHGHGHGHGHGKMHQHLQRMLDVAKASPEQRAQIKHIMDTAHNDLAPQRQARQQFHAQQQALMAQPNVDARAAETLRQQWQAQRDVVSKRMLQAQLDVARVLSPEQRKLMAERMNQHRAMMERHRSERESLK